MALETARGFPAPLMLALPLGLDLWDSASTLTLGKLVIRRQPSQPVGRLPTYASTKGNRGGKLPGGNIASRSPARSLSAASWNAAKDSPYASHRAFRTFFRRAWKNGAGDFLIFRGRVSGFCARTPSGPSGSIGDSARAPGGPRGAGRAPPRPTPSAAPAAAGARRRRSWRASSHVICLSRMDRRIDSQWSSEPACPMLYGTAFASVTHA